MINSSLDWNLVETKLKKQVKNLQYSRDLIKMINNISFKINILSINEIEMRRNRSNSVKELLIEINNEISEIEESILMATILG